MRTTLVIGDDVLEAARGLAERDRKTVGEIVTELARKGLRPAEEAPAYRNGIRLMPRNGRTGVTTLELVNRLRDDFE